MDKLLQEMVNLRRHFHMYPELGGEEFATCEYIQNYLQELGIQNERLGATGVIGLIPGSGRSAKVLAIRADIDALAVQEETELEFKSKHDGIMHACGHDGHTAILLGLARYLKEQNYLPAGTVKLIFQPAEEKGGDAGARGLIQKGCLKNPDVTAIIGYHLWPELESGQYMINNGAQMAGNDRFKITITGKGGHGAYPARANNPINGAVAVCTAINSIPARLFSAGDYTALSVCRLAGGTSFNIIPAEAVIEGSVRTTSLETREKVLEAIEAAAKNICQGYGLSCQVEAGQIAPLLLNTPEIAELARQAVTASGLEVVPDTAPAMVSEDFGHYLQHVPGAFMLIGARPQRGEAYFLHNPKFDFDSTAMKHTVRVLAEFIERFFNTAG